jgi:hypothetical protein
MTLPEAIEFAKKRIQELRIQKRLGHHPETGVAWQPYHQDLLDLFVEGLSKNKLPESELSEPIAEKFLDAVIESTRCEATLYEDQCRLPKGHKGLHDRDAL